MLEQPSAQSHSSACIGLFNKEKYVYLATNIDQPKLKKNLISVQVFNIASKLLLASPSYPLAKFAAYYTYSPASSIDTSYCDCGGGGGGRAGEGDSPSCICEP